MNRALLLLVPMLAAIVVFAMSSTTRPQPAEIGPVARLAPAGEPGTPLIVAGRVFDPSGTRGVAGVRLEAYHTDAQGEYDRTTPLHPARLHGTVVTDADGRFEWHTIRPMPYPGRTNPAHIHVQASGGGYPDQWVDELWFSDDPFISPKRKADAAAKGKFNPIITTARDARGALHAAVNVRLSNNPEH